LSFVPRSCVSAALRAARLGLADSPAQFDAPLRRRSHRSMAYLVRAWTMLVGIGQQLSQVAP
jgi:hypothetical protein